MVGGRRPVQSEIDGFGGTCRQRRRQQCERQSRDPENLHGTLLVCVACGRGGPPFRRHLSLAVVASTNATRDGPNCQLSGWKCPNNDQMVPSGAIRSPPART